MEDNNQEHQNQEQQNPDHQNPEFQILDSLPTESPKSFTDRYFQKYWITDFGGIKNNNLMLLLHSNRIVILTLARTHFFFSKQGDFKLNFTVDKVDRLSNSVKGKGKKGGQKLQASSVICKVEFNDGTSFDVPSGVKGTLLEINDDLVAQPELLRQCPDGNGYIAIILSPLHHPGSPFRVYNIVPN